MVDLRLPDPLGRRRLLVATVAGLTWWSVRSAEPQSSTLVHESSDFGVAVPRDDEPAVAGTPLQVLLELDSCEVYIEPGASGEPLSVEAHYDAHDYRLEEIVDEGSPGAYRLRFLVTSSRLITGIKPVAEFDVGGALLKVDADDHLQGDLERFTVKGSQGGVVLESLNLMQPQRIDIDFSMGQMLFDFRGPWTSDTTVDLSMSMADAIVRLPRESRVNGLGTDHLASSPTEELRPPTLTFAVESGARTTLRVFE